MIIFSAFGTAAANGGGIDEKTARKLLEEEVRIPPFFVLGVAELTVFRICSTIICLSP